MSERPDFSPEAIAEALREATPGPWEATYSHDILADISAPGREVNAVVYDDEGRALHANVYAPTRYDGILPDDDDRRMNPHSNWRADAHLIANAPTWLAQLLVAREAERAAHAETRRERHGRTEVFGECISDYERLRGYLSRRYGDTLTQQEVNAWMADNGYGLFVEGVPEADAWRERFWPNLPKDEPEPSESTQEYEHRYGKRAERQSWYSDEDHREAY